MSRREKQMIVEGEDDKFAIIELMGHHVDWPDEIRCAPVYLSAVGGVDGILDRAFITTKISESELKILGIVLDADIDFEGRWRVIRGICCNIFESVPDCMPKDGLILQENELGPRLGIWVMPDNQQHGMLETFLLSLINDDADPLLRYAKSVVVEAFAKGAPCKSSHINKAEIHTWLAWHDPPGLALGRAITSKVLDPHMETAKPFIEWFRKLYQIPSKGPAV